MVQEDLGYYPMNEEIGYSAQLHCWVLNGRVLSDEEAEIIYAQKASERQALCSRRETDSVETEETIQGKARRLKFKSKKRSKPSFYLANDQMWS